MINHKTQITYHQSLPSIINHRSITATNNLPSITTADHKSLINHKLQTPYHQSLPSISPLMKTNLLVRGLTDVEQLALEWKDAIAVPANDPQTGDCQRLG